MQHIDRAEQHLDRLADRQMQIGRFDHDIVLAVGIAGDHAQRIFSADVAGVGCAELAVLAGQAETPLPLLADDFDLGCVARNVDELAPDEQAGNQQGRDPDRGDDRQPRFEPLVLRFVGRPVPFPMTEAEDAIGHE